MGIKNWFRKTFQKNKIICAYVFDETGRFKEYVVYPSGNYLQIKLDGKDCTFYFRNEDIVYNKGLPCVMLKQRTKEAFNVKQEKFSEITPQEFNTAINNSVVKELMKAGNENKNEQLLLAGVGICVIGILILAYFTNTLMETLNAQQEIIKTLETEITKISSTIR